MKFSYCLLTRIEFGAGTLEHIGEEAPKLGTRALIVIGRGGSMRWTGVLDRAAISLYARGVEAIVSNRIQPNPTTPTTDEGVKVAREECCDLVIGLGGGSPCDHLLPVQVAVQGEIGRP